MFLDWTAVICILSRALVYLRLEALELMLSNVTFFELREMDEFLPGARRKEEVGRALTAKLVETALCFLGNRFAVN